MTEIMIQKNKTKNNIQIQKITNINLMMNKLKMKKCNKLNDKMKLKMNL